MNIASLTFPRSGSHFLKHCIKKTTGHEILRLHALKDAPPSYYKVTIVRDPFDAISSIVAMNRKVFKDNKHTDNPMHNMDWQINFEIDIFKTMYKEFLVSIDLFIKYDDLVNNTEKTINTLIDNFRLSKVNELGDYLSSYDEESKTFEGNIIKTSKNLLDYALVKDALLDYDLSECYNLYNQALSRCISIK